MAVTKVTSKYQITIPKQIRVLLNLKEGDLAEFESKPSGEIILRKGSTGTLSDGAAAKFMKRKKHLSVEEMKAAAKAGALKSFKGKN